MKKLERMFLVFSKKTNLADSDDSDDSDDSGDSDDSDDYNDSDDSNDSDPGYSFKEWNNWRQEYGFLCRNDADCTWIHEDLFCQNVSFTKLEVNRCKKSIVKL